VATGTQWTESPSGVWRNHALSTRLRWNAIQRMVFAPFPTPEPGYGAGRGENITIPRMGAITEPTSPVLSEDERIPEDKHTISVTSITVQEIGRAHRVTEKFLKLSKYSMKNKIHQWLEKQLGLSLDTLIAAAFKGCKVKYTPLTATTNQIDTAGGGGQGGGGGGGLIGSGGKFDLERFESGANVLESESEDLLSRCDLICNHITWENKASSVRTDSQLLEAFLHDKIFDHLTDTTLLQRAPNIHARDSYIRASALPERDIKRPVSLWLEHYFVALLFEL